MHWMTEGKNFSGQPTPSIIDDHYRRCNFAQPAPVDSGGGVYVGVRLFPGDDTPPTFQRCNLANCEPPPGSTVVDCMTALITSSDTTTDIIVDSNTIATAVETAHEAVGRWTPGGYVYP